MEAKGFVGVMRGCMFRAFMVSVLVLLSVSFCVPALADGAFEDEIRKPTQEEQEFYRFVMETIEAALPPCPEDWVLDGQTMIKPLEEVRWVGGPQAKPYPIQANYNVRWNNPKAMSEAALAALATGKAGTDSSQAVDPRLRLIELSNEWRKARDAGDKAKQEEIEKEMEKVKQQLDPANQPGAQTAQEANRDLEASVDVIVNEFPCRMIDLESPVVELPPIAGACVFRVEGKHMVSEGPLRGYEGREGCTYVFMGNGWSLDEDDRVENRMIMSFPERDGVPHTTVQTIIIEVEADAERARSILESMDWNALNALLYK